MNDKDKELQRAIRAGDVDKLQEIAACVCCCADHTFEGCPARAWSGCRGTGSLTRADLQSWQRHYERYHGMTEAQFYDWPV